MNTLDITLRSLESTKLREANDRIMTPRYFLDSYLKGLQDSGSIKLIERHPKTGLWQVGLTDQNSHFYGSQDEIALNLTKLVNSHLAFIDRSELIGKYDILVR
nr:hypothetical protein [Nanoarchaeum sp.]